MLGKLRKSFIFFFSIFVGKPRYAARVFRPQSRPCPKKSSSKSGPLPSSPRRPRDYFLILAPAKAKLFYLFAYREKYGHKLVRDGWANYFTATHSRD